LPLSFSIFSIKLKLGIYTKLKVFNNNENHTLLFDRQNVFEKSV
jgi:hypothetical protein